MKKGKGKKKKKGDKEKRRKKMVFGSHRKMSKTFLRKKIIFFPHGERLSYINFTEQKCFKNFRYARGDLEEKNDWKMGWGKKWVSKLIYTPGRFLLRYIRSLF